MQKASVTRALRAAGGDDSYGDDAWLQLRTKSGTVAGFQAAVDAANEVAIENGDAEFVIGDFVSSTPRGFAVQLTRASEPAAVHRWTATLAQRLTDDGFDGKLGGAPDTPSPPCLQPARGDYEPSGHIAWTLTDEARGDYRPGEWLVAPEATVRICELVDHWTRRPNAAMHLRQGFFTAAVDLPSATAQLQRAVTSTGYAGLRFIADPQTTATHVSLTGENETIFQSIGAPGGWREAIDDVIQGVVALPQDVDIAFIRPKDKGATSFSQMHYPLTLPEDAAQGNAVDFKHLLDRYMLDAHGVQVVRTAHLDNAYDLSDWQITDLGHGRHLVQAHDLEPWYSTPLPDATVVAQARADFAGALITADLAVAHPPAWRRARSEQTQNGIPSLTARITRLDVIGRDHGKPQYELRYLTDTGDWNSDRARARVWDWQVDQSCRELCQELRASQHDNDDTGTPTVLTTPSSN